MNKILKNNFYKKILSILAGLGIVYNFELNNNNILIIIFSYLYYNLIKKVEYKDKRKIICAILFSLLSSMTLFFGKQYDTQNYLVLEIIEIIKILLLSISIFLIVYNLFDLVPLIMKKDTKVYKVSFLKIFLPLSITGIIYFLILYPGVYGYDSGYQIAQFMKNNVNISNSFSLINSYFMFIFVILGKSLFNSYIIGFSFYTIIQMFFINFVLTKLFVFIYKKTNNIKVIIILTIFYIFFPLHYILSLSSCQDVFYTGFLILLGMEIYKYVIDNNDNSFYIILYSLLLSLSRNNGIHIIIISLIFIFLFKENRKKTLFIAIIIIFLNILISNGIIYIFSASKSESLREILSLPSQQIINVYTYNYKNLNVKDKAKIELFYPEENKKYYNIRQSIADLSKGSLDVKYTKEHIIDYVGLYFKLAINYPKNYINAFFLNTLGLWYPEKTYYDSRMYHPYIEIDMLDAHFWNKDYIEIQRKPIINLNQKLENYINNNEWQNLPILSMFYKGGTYFCFILFIILYNIYKKTYINILCIVVLLAQYLILILSPVIIFRYLYSIILFMPITLLTLYSRKKR